jgi:hypothetical protein
MGEISTIERYLDVESVIVANEVIDNRLKLKKIIGEKINILFICHRPQIWNSLKTVYESFLHDEKFNVTILAIPNKKQLPNLVFAHEEYESEGAEEFWSKYGCVCGYNYDTKEWIDPKSLKPDYVFFQTPYDVTRSTKYKSWIVSKYAKICYVAYGYQIAGGELFYKGVYNETFLRSTKFVFAFDKYHYDDIKTWLKKINNITSEVIMSGNPRNDLMDKGKENVSRDKYTVLWTPRWCTDESNCFFFDLKDSLLDYCDINDDFQLVFRPHPQAFLEWESTGEFTRDEAQKYIGEYEKRENAQIDFEKDYLKTFEKVDCFVTDLTSLMAEYLFSGKPVIYCHKVDLFTDAGRKMAQSFYWVRNENELLETLDMLRRGEDPLREKRLSTINEMFFQPDNGAGNCVKESIKKDAYNETAARGDI